MGIRAFYCGSVGCELYIMSKMYGAMAYFRNRNRFDLRLEVSLRTHNSCDGNSCYVTHGLYSVISVRDDRAATTKATTSFFEARHGARTLGLRRTEVFHGIPKYITEASVRHYQGASTCIGPLVFPSSRPLSGPHRKSEQQRRRGQASVPSQKTANCR